MVCHCGSQRSSDEPQWTSAMRAATGDSRDISALTKAHFAPVTINFNSFCSHPGAYQGRGSINDYGYMPPAVDAPFLDQRAMQAWPNAGGSNGDGNAMMSFANSLPHMSTYQHQVGYPPNFTFQNQFRAGALNGQNNTFSVASGSDGTQHPQFDAASAFGFGNEPQVYSTHASPAAQAPLVPDEAWRSQTCDTQMMNNLPSGDDPNNAASSGPKQPSNAGNAAVNSAAKQQTEEQQTEEQQTEEQQTADEHSPTSDFSSLLATPSPSLPSFSDTSTACASPDTILVSPEETSLPPTPSTSSCGRKTRLWSRVPVILPQDRLGELDRFIAYAKKLSGKPHVISNPVSTRPEWRKRMQELRNSDQPVYYLLACRELGLTYEMIRPLFNILFQTNYKHEHHLRTLFYSKSKVAQDDWMQALLRQAKDFARHNHFGCDSFRS